MKKINVINRVVLSCYDNDGELKIVNTNGKNEISFIKIYEDKQTYNIPQFLTAENYLSLISNLFTNSVKDIYKDSLVGDETKLTLYSNTQIFSHGFSYSKSHDAYINTVMIQLIEFENSKNKLDTLSIYNRLVNNDEFKNYLDEYFKERIHLNLYQVDNKLDESVKVKYSSDELDKMVSSFLEDHKEEIEGRKESITIHHVFVIFLIAVFAVLSALLFI